MGNSITVFSHFVNRFVRMSNMSGTVFVDWLIAGFHNAELRGMFDQLDPTTVSFNYGILRA